MKKKLFRFSIAAILVTLSSSALASGFMLSEQNAVQTGDFGAGGAAIAEDASTNWFNSAGLVRITKPQIVLAGNQIDFQTRFTGTTTLQNSQTPQGPINVFGTQVGTVSALTTSQTAGNIHGGTNNFVPAFHAAYPINSRLVAGFSAATPFGLSTDYNNDTLVRYAATKTKLRTIDLSPSLAFAITKKLSVGAGLDFERLNATFDNYVGLQNVQVDSVFGDQDINGNAFDTYSHNNASDWAKGWHAGFMFQANNATRIGLAYHSKIIHHATGYSTFEGPLADTGSHALVNGPASFNADSSLTSNDAKANVYLPANTMLSIYHDMNNRWALMGSVVYTQWSVFKHINLQNIMVSTNTSNDVLNSVIVPQIVNVNVPENFRNTWRASIGTNYKFNDQWLARAGVGVDQDPTNNTDRNLRLPDGTRYGVAVGGRYQATKNLALDGGYTHEFIRASSINNTTVGYTQSVQVSGRSNSSANVFGLQLTYSFA